MRNINRREFVKQSAKLGAGLTVASVFACKGENKMVNEGLTARIPMPIQIVIDDVGWWSGEDGSVRQEPYRTGIKRKHVPADYQAIADLGKKLGVRPQAATVLCEWDRDNILRELPTSTWMREKWDNSKWVGPWLEEAADIIRNNKKHYELSLHGIGHEYWQDKNFTRAEWADKSGTMRPLDQVELHLDYFARLMDQNQLGPFPTSFVPTAFLHGFGPTGDHQISMAGVIKKRGITYINTPFYNMYNAAGAQFKYFGIDAGVITVDRGEDVCDWDIIGGRPEGNLPGPCCGLHWPNMLHEDPDRNSEIVDHWVKFLKPYNQKMETMLAPDSDFFQQQLVHYTCTGLSLSEKSIDLDFTGTQSIPDKITNGRFMLKISAKTQLEFDAQNITIKSDLFEIFDDNYRYSLVLERFPEKMTAKISFRNAT